MAPIDYSDAGERVVDIENGGLFYAHLSLYELAVPFLRGKHVLDAGCGTGYGCAHLVSRGALSVTGIDLSPKAINYSRTNFDGPNLNYEISDLNCKLRYPDESFDAIFSSNAMEHISQIDSFLSEAHRILTRAGVFFAAVPAITTVRVAEDNIRNVYHVTNLTPLCWHRKISRYFAQVRTFRHWARDPTGDWSSFRETDWLLAECEIELANSTQQIANVVFVATRPRSSIHQVDVEEFLLTDLRAKVLDASRLRATLEEVYRSKTWRSTVLLRAAARWARELMRKLAGPVIRS
jgi:SAM-dependent methyltransferase